MKKDIAMQSIVDLCIHDEYTTLDNSTISLGTKKMKGLA